jgi:hypothetical protein
MNDGGRGERETERGRSLLDIFEHIGNAAFGRLATLFLFWYLFSN